MIDLKKLAAKVAETQKAHDAACDRLDAAHKELEAAKSAHNEAAVKHRQAKNALLTAAGAKDHIQ